MNAVAPSVYPTIPTYSDEQDFCDSCDEGCNPLLERVSENWKTALMDLSTVISIIGIFATFLAGYSFLCCAFILTAAASAIAGFYMREFAVLPGLDQIRENYAIENNRLQESNEVYRLQNATLTQTNAQLTHQVAELTLQVSQLRVCAERIRTEVAHLQEHNVDLRTCVRALDQQLTSSRALCDQIEHQLGSHERGIGEQLEQLRTYLQELSADNRVSERIHQLAALQEQTRQAVDQLHTLQLQYTETRTQFTAVHDALQRIRNQFDTALEEAARNNADLRINVTELARERQRIHGIFDRYFPHDARG